MNKIRLYKKILIGITVVVFLLILIFTIDVIRETPNRSFLDIDFQNKDNIVSAYGTLIGGILAFLSILFVLFGLLEQRLQIITEKAEKEEENKQELIDQLKLLSSYFKSTIDDILAQGKTFSEYSQKEQDSPSEMNTMHFTANKNFTRIIDINPLSIYKAIRTNFQTDENWEKMFLNIYSIFDFYSDGLRELKEKYESQIAFKVKEQRKISFKIRTLFNHNSTLIDKYKTKHPKKYMSYPWVKLSNEFTSQYYAYLEDCKANDEPSNLRIISDNFLLPFLTEAMKLRDDPGYEKPICRKLVVSASNIRKDISEIEFRCIHYARDIEKQFNEYFSEENKHLKELKRLKLAIDNKLNE
jgi:large-conductance mechanosensitive channel